MIILKECFEQTLAKNTKFLFEILAIFSAQIGIKALKITAFGTVYDTCREPLICIIIQIGKLASA